MSHKYVFLIPRLLVSALILLSELTACYPQVLKTASPTTQIPIGDAPTSFPIPASPTPILPPTQEVKSPTEAGPRIISAETAAQLVVQNRFGKGWFIGGPLYSPNGQWLAVPTAAGVYLFDAQSDHEMRAIPQISPTLAFSPDSEMLATGGMNSLCLYKSSDGSLLKNLSDEAGHWYSAIDFSRDGSLVGAGDQGQLTSLFWSTSDGSYQYSVVGEYPDFSPTADLVITNDMGKSAIYLYNSKDGSLQNQWTGERAGFLSSGQLWIENAGSVQILDLEKDLAMAPINGRQATFSADGSRLAVFAEGRIILYEVSTGRVVSTLEGSFSSVEVMALSFDGQYIAASTNAPMCPGCIDEGKPLAVWNIADGKPIPGMDGIGWANLFTFSPDGQSLIVAKTERLEFWRMGESSPADVLDGFYTSVAGLAISPDHRTLAVVNDSSPYTIRFWDLVEGKLLEQVQASNSSGAISYAQVNYSPDGQTLVVEGDVWRQNEGGVWSPFPLNNKEVPPFRASSNAISPDGNTLATGYDDGSLLLWNLPDGSLREKLEGPQDPVNYLVFSTDGKHLAAIYYQYPSSQVQVWNIAEGGAGMSIQGYRFARLAFSPKNDTLAVIEDNPVFADNGPEAGSVQFWHLGDPNPYQTLDMDNIMSLAFSPDGNLIATGSIDGKVRLWQVEGGQLLQTIELGEEWMEDLAFTADGTRLICGSVSGVVTVLGLGK